MAEGELLLLCRQDDLEPGSKKLVARSGGDLVVYNIDGAFYATDDRCTHGLSSLAEGELMGDEIECAMHFGSFHVPTGKPMAPPCSIPIRTYETRVVGDEVFAVVG